MKDPRAQKTSGSHTADFELLLRAVMAVEQRLVVLEQITREMLALLEEQQIEKEWYSTTDVAALMKVSQYTVQERWCNQGRIECEKDSENGKWRVPGHEFRRLRAGGKPRRLR